MTPVVLGAAGGVGRALVQEFSNRGVSCIAVVRPGGRTFSEPIPGARVVEADYGMFVVPDDVSVLIDAVGSQPEQQCRLLDQVRGSSVRYQLMSSIAVYSDTSTSLPTTEASLTVPPSFSDDLADSPETYSSRKAACEIQSQTCGVPSQVIRAGMLVGPTDSHSRLESYLFRMAHRSPVIWAGERRDPLQLLDLRDLAQWIADCALAPTPVAGVFNAVGGMGAVSIGDLHDACAAATLMNPECCWVPSSALIDLGVVPFVDMPLWPGDPEKFYSVDDSSAVTSGLQFRPLSETVSDVWYGQPPSRMRGPEPFLRELEITLRN